MAKHWLASLHPMSVSTSHANATWIREEDGRTLTVDPDKAFKFPSRRSAWLAANRAARGKAIRLHKIIDGEDTTR